MSAFPHVRDLSKKIRNEIDAYFESNQSEYVTTIIAAIQDGLATCVLKGRAVIDIDLVSNANKITRTQMYTDKVDDLFASVIEPQLEQSGWHVDTARCLLTRDLVVSLHVVIDLPK